MSASASKQKTRNSISHDRRGVEELSYKLPSRNTEHSATFQNETVSVASIEVIAQQNNEEEVYSAQNALRVYERNVPARKEEKKAHGSTDGNVPGAQQSAKPQAEVAKAGAMPSAPRSGQSFERSQMIGEDYVLLQDLGEGTFGNVKLGKHMQSGQLVAVKILEKNRITDQADVERVIREIKILKGIRHVNIIKLYEIIETKSNIYLIMEYATGGELFDYIVSKDRLSERESWRFFNQIVAGMEFLHQRNIAHRDLKPENLLLDKNKNLKIVDFGLSNTY